MDSSKAKKSEVAIRAGIWYTICNFLDKGLVFLTTPIFTRLLSKSDIGTFSNFTVWLTIITYIVTMDMHVTITRARFDFRKELDQYISSIAILSFFSTLLFYAVMFFFQEPMLRVMGMNKKVFNLMMCTVAFSGSFEMFQIEHRVHYKYKKFVLMTLLLNSSTIVLSLLLIQIVSDQLIGRIMGYVIPRWIIYIILFYILLYKGRCFKLEYCKYCLKVCIPYIPHLLSLYILSASDRAMIMTLRGSEEVALYSIGYTCAMVVSLLGNSMNLAWSPWLTERIHQKDYTAIRKCSIRYLGFFITGVTMIGFIAPELLLFMGGRSYESAVYVLPPVMAGCIFQFCYTMYVNIETYEKKTGRMALATMTGAVGNVILNYIFIPKYGYIAAAFTTLAGYGLLFCVHYCIVRQMGKTNIYNTKFVLSMLVFSCAMIFVYYFLYQYLVLRIVVIVVILSILIFIFFMFKEQFNHFIRLLKGDGVDMSR